MTSEKDECVVAGSPPLFETSKRRREGSVTLFGCHDCRMPYPPPDFPGFGFGEWDGGEWGEINSGISNALDWGWDGTEEVLRSEGGEGGGEKWSFKKVMGLDMVVTSLLVVDTRVGMVFSVFVGLETNRQRDGGEN